MAESAIEKRYCKLAKDEGDIVYKFISPNHRGVPDRLRLSKIPEEHREIVARYIRFVELKDTGKKPEPHQVREHKRLRDLGFKVEVVDRCSGK
jgi:hypothetical protein